MNRMKALWILWMVLGTAPAWGAGTLTLPQAVTEGLARNPTMKKLAAAEEGASWKRDESVAGFLPHVTVDGAHYLDAKYSYLGLEFGGAELSMPSAFPGTDLALTACVNLFDGFRGLKGVQAGNLGKRAASLDREDGAFKLVRQIQVLFDQALGAQALLDVAQRRIDSLEELRKITQAREDGGAGTRYDRLRVETLLEEAQANRTVAQDNVYLARKRLARTMGLESDVRVLEGTLPVPDPKRIPAALATDDSGRSDLRALELRGQALDKQSGMALAGYWPRVDFLGQKMFYKYGSFDPLVLTTPQFQGAYSVWINVHWDLFDGGADLAKSKEAGAAAEQARQTLQEGKLQASEDRETWSRRYLDNALLYHARVRNIERAAESLRLAQLGLRQGTQTNLNVLEAESDLYNSRAGAIQAQLDAVEAWVRLEIALGRGLQ